MANKMSDISDVDVYMPDLLKTTVQWLTNYKVSNYTNYSLIKNSNKYNGVSASNIFFIPIK